MSAPSLSTLARRVLDDACVPASATVLVACSGGLDSQVLLDVLSHLAAPKRGAPRLRVVACGVDHGLRSAAKEELSLAAELAAARGVPFHELSVQLERGGNLQARARAARYAAMRALGRDVGAHCIATGHHRDDRAETVLIRILRGAPIEGLAVLAPSTHDVLRPLIAAPRSQLEAHARRRHLAWAVDPSNSDPRHLRTRVRHEVMPLLRALDPRVDEHLVALAEGASHRTVRDDAERQLSVVARDGASARAIDALRAAKAASPAKAARARVFLRGDRTAHWDQQGDLIITGGTRWRGR